MARNSLGIPPTVSLTLASAFWAVGTVISKALLSSVPPIAFLVIQLVPSVCVLWVLVLATGRQPVSWRGTLPVALIGWLNPGLSYTFSMLGLTHTTASVATLLWAAEPALIVVMAWLVLREAVTLRFFAATTMAACGVLLVSGFLGNGEVMPGSAYAAALILGGVLCCALYTVLSRKLTTMPDPLFTVAIQQTVGLVWAVVILALELHGAIFDSALALSPRSLIGGGTSGLMYYAAAFWFYLKGLRSVSASRASIFLNLTPVFGVALAFAFLGERLSASQWVGAATILVSVLALLMWSSPEKVPASAN